MAKPHKGSAVKTDTPSTTGADNQPSQAQSRDVTDTPQLDAHAGIGAADGTGAGDGAGEGADQSTAGPASTDAAGTGRAPPSGHATGADNTPQPDERVLVRFTGPWKNYSRGDVTRLPDAEARCVIAKGLALQQDE